MLTARRRSSQLLGAAVALKGIAWVGSHPASAACFILLGLIIAVRRHVRAAAAMASALAWIITIEGQDASHHLALMALLTGYLALAGDPGDADVLQPTEILHMVQISSVYLYGALWKLNPEFLSGSVVGVEWELSWLFGPSGAPPALTAAAAIATIVAELFIALTLWLARLPLVVTGAAMLAIHGGMVLTIGMDPATTLELLAFGAMTASALPFFATLRPRRGSPSIRTSISIRTSS
ncbi:hypothetical protein [Actinomarinicola tropica]|uniref:HTTM domain-containing protein n=1 Tax=Actinomarinicola tropica TaxID=2789776 RepID=A0A5Q2RNI5_9ACTN|nr:hypothetical protein [Actinomarinicola tropica]QGG95460.1 hypothetical protein GH723_10320 [Actinomarinicola tropica]